MGGVKKLAKGVFGGGGSAGMMGTGRFKAKTRDIRDEAFTKQLAGTGRQAEARSQQKSQIKRLEDRATGKAPSIAEAQLQQATDRSLKQQLAAAQSRRGGSASARERQLARGITESRQQVASQSATARLKEQQLADQALASQLSQQRQQDIQVAEADRKSRQALEQLETKQFLAAQGANLSGFQSAAQNRGQFVSNIGGGIASVMSDEDQKKNIKDESDDIDTTPPKPPAKKEKKSADPKKAMALATMLSDKDKKSSVRKENDNPKERRLTKDEVRAKNKKTIAEYKKSDASRKRKETARKFAKGFSDSNKKGREPIAGEAGRRMADRFAAEISDSSAKKDTQSYSDKDTKKNVSSHSPKKFLDALTAYSYEYKDPSMKGAGEGRHLSVMAQDLEKTPVGKQMVVETPQGKMVDYGKGFGAMLASQAHLNERIKSLESKKKKKS